MNYIVLRQSPDWLAFDLNQTRAFCTKLGFPEALIIDFAKLWDRHMALSFKQYRYEMKRISLRSVYACQSAQTLTVDAFQDQVFGDDDTVFFTDDDDWIGADLFSRLSARSWREMQLWGSVYVGQIYADTPQAKSTDPVVSLRPLNARTVFTNNYAVKGLALQRHGKPALLEHFDAQQLVDDARLKPSLMPDYLTAANKHPCCTMAILFNVKSNVYLNDIEGHLARFTDELAQTQIPQAAPWIKDHLNHLIEVNRACLGR